LKNEEIIQEIDEQRKNYELLIKRKQAVEFISRLQDNIDLFKKIKTNIEKYRISLKKYETLKNKYEQNFHQFLKNQAFTISQKLEDKMPCPVCGSINHPSKPVRDDNTITELQLNSSKVEYENEYDRISQLSSNAKSILLVIQSRGMCNNITYIELLDNSTPLDDTYYELKKQYENQYCELQKINDMLLKSFDKSTLKNDNMMDLQFLNDKISDIKNNKIKYKTLNINFLKEIESL
jgi:exonuclease SbcC